MTEKAAIEIPFATEKRRSGRRLLEDDRTFQFEGELVAPRESYILEFFAYETIGEVVGLDLERVANMNFQ